MRSLFAKTLYDKRFFALGWATALAFTAFILVIFFPSFSGGDQIAAIAEKLPEQLKGIVGDLNAWKTIQGYISTQIFDIRIPLFMMVMAIVLGQSLSVSEEESGRLRTVLSAPTSRAKVLFQKWLAIVVITGLMSLAITLAIYMSVAIIGETPPNTLLWQLCGLSWLYGTVTTTIVMAIGLASGKRSLTMFVSILVVVGSFILTTFGKSVSWLKPYENASLLHYYNASSISSGTYKTWHLGVLFGVLAIMLVVGILGFRRRDVA